MKKRIYKVEILYHPEFSDGKYIRCITQCKIKRDTYIGSYGCGLCENFVETFQNENAVQCNGSTLFERLFRRRRV